MKIGRYSIAFGRTFWIQTWAPTTMRRFLFFWIFKEVRHQDVDRVDLEPQFSLGTRLDQDGLVYHYFKADKDIVVRDEPVREKV